MNQSLGVGNLWPQLIWGALIIFNLRIDQYYTWSWESITQIMFTYAVWI